MYTTLGKVLCLLAFGSWASCQAGDFVWRKPGLWEINIYKPGESVMRAVKVRQCSDARSEPDILLSIVPGQEHCAPLEIRRSSSKRVIKSHCRVHDTKVDAQMTMSGDFGAAYRGDFNVRYVPGTTTSQQAGETLFEATWIGPCAAGMVAGDMVLSNGITVNVLRDKKAHDSEAE